MEHMGCVLAGVRSTAYKTTLPNKWVKAVFKQIIQSTEIVSLSFKIREDGEHIK